MPKDEVDFEDPFELNGLAICTEEDTTDAMSECFIEEYLRMGYNHGQILALFHDPFYVGPHLAYEKRGEAFIRDLIAEVFARWGKPVGHDVRSAAAGGPTAGHDVRSASNNDARAPVLAPPPFSDLDPSPTDPMGTSIPRLNR